MMFFAVILAIVALGSALLGVVAGSVAMLCVKKESSRDHYLMQRYLESHLPS